MTCFFCRGDLERGSVAHMADLGHCIVIIKSVPCMKCSQCGEVIFTGDVVKRIEDLISALENTLTEIAVINYSEKVA